MTGACVALTPVDALLTGVAEALADSAAAVARPIPATMASTAVMRRNSEADTFTSLLGYLDHFGPDCTA